MRVCARYNTNTKDEPATRGTARKKPAALYYLRTTVDNKRACVHMCVRKRERERVGVKNGKEKFTTGKIKVEKVE